MKKLMTTTALFLIVVSLAGCGSTKDTETPESVAALPTSSDGSPVPGETLKQDSTPVSETEGRGAQRLGGGYCRATCTKKKHGINYYSTRDGLCGGNAFGNCCGSLDFAYGTWRSKCFPL